MYSPRIQFSYLKFSFYTYIDIFLRPFTVMFLNIRRNYLSFWKSLPPLHGLNIAEKA